MAYPEPSSMDEVFGVGAEAAEAFVAFQERILEEILAERSRQIEACKHGGDTNEFDKGNSRNDWIAYVNAYIGRAAEKVHRNEREGQQFRENMLKAAALCMAAIEAHDQGWC